MLISSEQREITRIWGDYDIPIEAIFNMFGEEWSVVEYTTCKGMPLKDFLMSEDTYKLFTSYTFEDLIKRPKEVTDFEYKHSYLGLSQNETIIFNFINLALKKYAFVSNIDYQALQHIPVDEYVYSLY